MKKRRAGNGFQGGVIKIETSIGQHNISWLCEKSGGDEQAAAWLNPEERIAYTALRNDKRRHDWLLGRRVAKHLIHAVLSQQMGSAPPLQEIVVLRHPDGWPRVTLPSLGATAPPLTLSISHSHDHAFCALVLGEDRPLGCDIEAIEPRSPGFVVDYFTADERALMAAAPEGQHPTLANAIWSGKEAALKAIRRGLAEDTRLVTCLPSMAEEQDGWRSLDYRWAAAERALPALIGHWREADGFVMTIAVEA